MSLIFLDIDGVLNGHDWSEEAKSCLLRQSCIQNFNKIIRAVDPVFVLSSAWRYMISGGATTMQGFEYMLRTHGVSEKFALVGYTPSDEKIPIRGNQITAWLEENTEKGKNRGHYVVIDDLDLGISEAGHPFYQTDGETGLTEEDADKIIEMLK